jgi:hypothetical protein
MVRLRKPSLKILEMTSAAAAATTTEKKKKKKATTTTTTTAAKSKLKTKKKKITTTTTTATTTAKRTTKKGAAAAAPAAAVTPRSRKKSVKAPKTTPVKKKKAATPTTKKRKGAAADGEEEKGQKKKKQQKKDKAGVQQESNTPQLLMEVFTNPRLVQDLFINPKWIPKLSDLVALGSTCKALGELRLGPETITQDLKHHKYRYIHRFIGALAQRPTQNLKSLSLSRIHSVELCDEVKHCLGTGNLLQLETLSLEGSYQHAMKDLLVPLVPAHLPALRSLTLRDMKISKGGPSWKKFQKALKSFLSAWHKERRKEEKKRAKEEEDKKQGVVKKKRKAAVMKVKAPVVCPLVHLESLTLEGIAVPNLVFQRWMEALHVLNTRTLRELTLIGLDVSTDFLKLAEMIQEGHFRKLEAFHLDHGFLQEHHAAQIIEALSLGCDALLELQLCNMTGRRWWGRHEQQNDEHLVAKLIECSKGSGGLQSLEVLAIGWQGLKDEHVDDLVDFVLGEMSEEAAELPFPNLYSFGLRAVDSDLPASFFCDLVKDCVKREVYQIDLRYSGLSLPKTRQIVETAKSVVGNLPRGEVLHLHLAQYRYMRPHEGGNTCYGSHVRYKPSWRRAPDTQSYYNLPKGLRVHVEKPWVK